MSEQGGPYGPGGQPNPGGQGSQGWQQGPPPTGPQGWQQAPQPSGPQGWQQGPPPTGPQGWQQAPQPTGPQGWQQAPQPTGPQGWQQGPPPTQGFPAGQGQPWTGQQPAQPPPAAKNRKPIIITAVAVVVALVGAAAVYFFAIRDSNTDVATGSSSPQQSVDALFKTLGNSDPIGIADQLDPAEAALFTDLNSDVIAELKRLEVLSSEASADKMTGTTIKVDGLTMQDQTETINDHVQIVKLTGGTVTVSSDPNSIPLSDSFKQQFGSEIDAAQPESQTVNIADAVAENGGEPIRVATVKRGDNWYVSLFYTIADNAVHAEGLPNPTQAQFIAPEGSKSPEAAVDALIDRGSKGDLKGVIALLPPDEMGVMHDYGQLILDQSDAGDLTTEMSDLGFEVGPITYDVTDVTGGKKVSFKSIELTADGQTVSIERDPAEGSVTLTAPGESPITLNESTIDTYLSDAIGSDELDAQGLDIVKREFKQLIGLGVVTVNVDGQWYVSPVRSFSDIFLSLMKGLEPGDVEYLIELSGN